MEAIESKLNKIITTVISNIPSAGWENFSLNICALNKMLSMEAFYEEKGAFISFDPEARGEDIMMEFKSLREIMYNVSPNKGAWYSASFTITNDHKLQAHFNYDDKPEFTYEPSKEKFIDDLNVFPREKALIPDWLDAIVNS
ncbi:immunity protein YezG family protein [Flavobacterium sp. DGU11]|uniref:Immunity protein YezG family protein n=1 Tax=Flavobacterium arundinis TaxID=3139143 RepID=A0ABU9HWA1_9FLAO